MGRIAIALFDAELLQQTGRCVAIWARRLQLRSLAKRLALDICLALTLSSPGCPGLLPGHVQVCGHLRGDEGGAQVQGCADQLP